MTQNTSGQTGAAQTVRTDGLDFLLERPVATSDFRADVIAGLSSTPRSIPPKYFYDAEGARLFESICELPEYYVTRAELDLLNRYAGEISRAAGAGASMIEPGSGAAAKARILLRAFDRPYEFVLFDISQEQLIAQGQRLAAEFPELRVGAVAGDFTADMPRADEIFSGAARRVCFFPGGTLGNFEPDAQRALLRNFSSVLRPGDGLLLGVDRVKDSAKLDAAYDDAAGVSAAFNLNLFTRLQDELGARLDPDAFVHRAFFNPELARIEMHLMARRPTAIEIDGQRFVFEVGETIHTENSYKFDRERLGALARDCGFEVKTVWGERAEQFMLAWLTLR